MRANRAVHSLVMSVSLNRRIPAYFWKRRNRAKPLVTPFSMDRQRSFDRAYCPCDARDPPVIEYHRPTTLIIFNAIIPVFAHADPNVFLERLRGIIEKQVRARKITVRSVNFNI